MSIEAIKIICPSCNGEERPFIAHSVCNGTGLINGQPDPACSGTGQIQDDICGVCNGAYSVGFGTLDNDLIDLLNDIKNKCDDIWQKVNE